VVQSGTFAVPTATVEMRVDGQPKKTTAQGDGPVDAVYKAIAELTDTKSELLQYQVKAITGGMDAQGEVTVTVTEDGRRVIGHGAHTDIIVASARAYVHALNKLEWHKRSRAVDEPKGI
jgi:2-isopropylmalate synthase